MILELQKLNFIKNLIYLLLFSLFSLYPPWSATALATATVAKKFYEIRATNYDKLYKTNPISEMPKMNVNKVLTRGYENKRLFRCAENKPKQTQFHPPFRALPLRSSPCLPKRYAPESSPYFFTPLFPLFSLPPGVQLLIEDIVIPNSPAAQVRQYTERPRDLISTRIHPTDSPSRYGDRSIHSRESYRIGISRSGCCPRIRAVSASIRHDHRPRVDSCPWRPVRRLLSYGRAAALHRTNINSSSSRLCHGCNGTRASPRQD